MELPNVEVVHSDLYGVLSDRGVSVSCNFSPALSTMSSEENIIPRVNSVRFKEFVGVTHPVRVTGKLVQVCTSHLIQQM